MLDLSRDEVGARRPRERPRASSRARMLSTSTARRRRSASPRRSGINSTTGIAGLTLGGGFGWTTRKLGLTVDNLRRRPTSSPPTGELVRANEKENADLFWAIRGGGGNFGVVTSFEYRLHRLGPGGARRARSSIRSTTRTELCASYREYRAEAPDEMTAGSCCARRRRCRSCPRSGTARRSSSSRSARSATRRAARRRLAQLRRFGKPIADMHRADAVRRLAGGVRPAARRRARATTGSRTTSTTLDGGADRRAPRRDRAAARRPSARCSSASSAARSTRVAATRRPTRIATSTSS